MMNSEWMLLLAGNLLLCLVIAIGVQVLLWRYSEHVQDATIADVWWGTGFACIAITSWCMARGWGDPLRNGVVTVLTTVWGLRLAFYIRSRSKQQPEDHRYTAYRREAQAQGRSVAWVMFRKVFGIQGLMMWITSIPIQVGQFLPGPTGPWLWIGVAVWAVGFIWETVADAHMTRFKRDPANKGQALTTGLWRYSRHPNYFGDAMVWWGLFLCTVDNGFGWLTIFAPIRMTYRLGYRRTLAPFEAKMKERRPAYADYVARTNRFWPWFPRQR
ncbi:DUF1295 domain-containing protein [Hydrogenophaga sp.]|uniref:DUF1295 domain-containing protein n=1 Tax=Hydrogenophaga sp. TaxID=1904254 RepID=UPI002715D5DD|nr:DUF1295 domain-containing protein [Hydrogenophaga sp.]MDO9438545.1 DUF1295 domain-containing protein [Hydrogenophaga sp.]